MLFVTARAPRRRRLYGARLPTALRPASWCCILRRQESSTARMRTGVATSRTNRSIFSVSVSERGKRCGKVFFPRTASCPPPARRHSRPSAGQSGDGRFISAVTSPCRTWPTCKSVHWGLDQLLRPILSCAVEIDSAAYRWLPSPLGAPKVQAPARTRLVGSGSPCRSKPLCSLAVSECRRPNIGSRVNREVHARF